MIMTLNLWGQHEPLQVHSLLSSRLCICVVPSLGIINLYGDLAMENTEQRGRRKGYYKDKYFGNWLVIVGFLLAVLVVMAMNGIGA